METVPISSTPGTPTLASTPMVNPTARATTLGQMARYTSVNSGRARDTAGVSGARTAMRIAIILKVTTRMIVNKGMARSSGQVGTSIEVNTGRMRDTGSVRCAGLMEVAIKVSGLKTSRTDTAK